MTLPLIAPKPFREFQPQEYYEYVQAMYGLKIKGRAKSASPVPGLTVARTKSGALSVRRSKSRAFEYVTMAEIAALAKAAKTSQADLWNLFKKKEYLITKDRMEAERLYGEIKELPW